MVGLNGSYAMKNKKMQLHAVLYIRHLFRQEGIFNDKHLEIKVKIFTSSRIYITHIQSSTKHHFSTIFTTIDSENFA